MSDLEMQRLKAEIVAMSAYYQVKLDPQVIAMYAEDLQDLPIDLVIEGYRKWRRNPKNARFPLPAQIRGLFADTSTDEDKARDAAGRIVAAISKLGYSNGEKAKEYIGSLGWEVVKRQGGWGVICERTMQDELPIYQSQWAKYALSLIHLIESGHYIAPELPQPKPLVFDNKIQNLLEIAKIKNPEEPR